MLVKARDVSGVRCAGDACDYVRYFQYAVSSSAEAKQQTRLAHVVSDIKHRHLLILG